VNTPYGLRNASHDELVRLVISHQINYQATAYNFQEYWRYVASVDPIIDRCAAAAIVKNQDDAALLYERDMA
jgi:ADP-glucose pyrophosphorylase